MAILPNFLHEIIFCFTLTRFFLRRSFYFCLINALIFPLVFPYISTLLFLYFHQIAFPNFFMEFWYASSPLLIVIHLTTFFTVFIALPTDILPKDFSSLSSYVDLFIPFTSNKFSFDLHMACNCIFIPLAYLPLCFSASAHIFIIHHTSFRFPLSVFFCTFI